MIGKIDNTNDLLIEQKRIASDILKRIKAGSDAFENTLKLTLEVANAMQGRKKGKRYGKKGAII